MSDSPYMCSKIVCVPDTACELKKTNPIRNDWQVCGMGPEADVHNHLSDGHHFSIEFLYHETHHMNLHPIDGVYCGVCKGYSYDKVDVLAESCAGPREWKAKLEQLKPKTSGATCHSHTSVCSTITSR